MPKRADPQRPLQADLSPATDLGRQFTPRTIPEPRDAEPEPLTRKPIGPGCMVPQPGAKRTLCGRRREDVPTTWVPWVVCHVISRDTLWCPDCTAIYVTLGET